MFRKILDKAKKLNIERWKLDSDVNIKKFQFYFKDQVKSLKQKTEKFEISQKFEKTKRKFFEKKKKFRFRKFDDLKNRKIGKWDLKISAKVKDGLLGIRNRIYRSKDDTRGSKEEIKNSWDENTEFDKESYLGKVFEDNGGIFRDRLEGYRNGYRRKRNKMLIIGGLVIFFYAAGSNLPHAIFMYNLSMEAIERARLQSDSNKILEGRASVSVSVRGISKIDDVLEMKEEIVADTNNRMEIVEDLSVANRKIVEN